MVEEKTFFFAPKIIKSFILRKLRKEELLLCFSFLIIVIFLFLGAITGVFRPQISQNQIIKEVAIKQNTIIDNQPVKWVKVVTASAIQGDRRYLELPKDAQNITIKTGQAALNIIREKSIELAVVDEKQLVVALIQPKTEKPNILTKAGQFLTANLGEAADQLKDFFKEKEKESEMKIIEAKDSKFVDLAPFALVGIDYVSVEYIAF